MLQVLPAGRRKAQDQGGKPQSLTSLSVFGVVVSGIQVLNLHMSCFRGLGMSDHDGFGA